MRILPSLRGSSWLLLATLAACHSGVRTAEPAPAPLSAPASITVMPMVRASNVIPLLEIPAGTHLDSHVLAASSLLVNGIDASFSELATGRTTQRDVLAFARRMVTDHTALSAQLRDVLAQIELSARDNDLTRSLRERGAEQAGILAGLSGRAFDTTYVQVEVNYHRQLLDLIDHVLLPNASRRELREYLVAFRPAISAHLAHAEQVRATLSARR